MHTEGVLFARSGSRYNRDFEDLVGWLATTMDKTALRRLVRVDWDTVGRIIERVMATGLDPGRLDKLFSIGVDEVRGAKAIPTSPSSQATRPAGSYGEAKEKTPPRSTFSSTSSVRSAAR